MISADPVDFSPIKSGRLDNYVCTVTEGGLIFLVLVAGLWFDSHSPIFGQILAGMLFWGGFIILYHRAPLSFRPVLMSCLLVGFFGEIFCSLIWGIYDYRLNNIPHYVPPGHVLVFMLGAVLAPRMPRWIVWLVPLVFGSYILSGWWLGFDRFGLVLFLMFLACLLAEEDRRLYATMFILCLLLELYGTWLENWRWKPLVPVWGITTENPPVGSGAFYCVLDFLMFRLALAWDSFSDVSFGCVRRLSFSFLPRPGAEDEARG